MTSEANPWRDWIGRTERRSDLVTPAPLAMLSATLDRDDPEPMPGSEVPPLWQASLRLARTDARTAPLTRTAVTRATTTAADSPAA